MVDDVHGVQKVLGVRSTGAWPIVIAREVTVPTPATRACGCGSPMTPARPGSSKRAHGTQVLNTEEITDANPDRWKTIEIDLSPVAGQTGWLTFRAQSTNGDHVLYVERVELVF